ncbi:MAG: hypothetical protein HRT57_05755 [Crocinitomicaceae bacterium]|nr:hypothetical protein [Crocinitomicaceae bacterium]
MKTLALIALLTIPFFGWNQIKFTAKNFDNGFRYPVIHFADNEPVQDSINAIIGRKIADLKTSDFCIGDYGYVQKGNHIELHLVCNCIDMDKADHRYYFFNLVDGTLVSHQDIFTTKKKEVALKIISHAIRKVKDANSCVADFGDITEDLDFSKMNIRLYKDGLEIRPSGTDCEKSPVRVKWTELSSCLKYNFI